MRIDGQCHCGRVTYEAAIDPQKVSICHCTDCQQLTGSPYRVTVICDSADVRLTGAHPKVYAKTADNAARAFSIFATNAARRCSRAERAVRTIGGFVGAAFDSVKRLSPRVRSGAARPRPGSMRSGNCRGCRPN